MLTDCFASQTLLDELRVADNIVAGSTWKSVYPLLADDPRYLNLVGTPGSSPLDLFWDVVDSLDWQAEDDQRIAESILSDRKQRVEESTTYEQFVEALAGDERVNKIIARSLKRAYDSVRAFLRLAAASLPVQPADAALLSCTPESFDKRRRSVDGQRRNFEYRSTTFGTPTRSWTLLLTWRLPTTT